MEVIVAEYTVIGFMPVILAAVSATTIYRIFNEGSAVFAIPGAHLASCLDQDEVNYIAGKTPKAGGYWDSYWVGLNTL